MAYFDPKAHKKAMSIVRAMDKSASTKKVYIDHHPDFDEYKVHLGRGTSGSYHNDKEDAVGTAKAEHGQDAKLVHRSRRYGPEPD